MTVLLPDKPTTKKQLDPLDARVLLAGAAKVGKSSLLSQWAPSSTLLIDTHAGMTLLDGEHFIYPVTNWTEFDQLVETIVQGDHKFRTIGIDLIDDIYRFADQHVAAKKGVAAAGMIAYGAGGTEADAIFRKTIGKLFASKYGIWFISHTDTEENDGKIKYIPRLNKRVRTDIEGACQFIFLAEVMGNRRVMHTAPSPKFGAGRRCPLPDVMDLSAKQLYEAMHKGLNPKSTSDGKDAA